MKKIKKPKKQISKITITRVIQEDGRVDFNLNLDNINPDDAAGCMDRMRYRILLSNVIPIKSLKEKVSDKSYIG